MSNSFSDRNNAQDVELNLISKNSIDSTDSDLLWDKIVSIESLGPMQVYDIEVEGTHNFVANGIVAHNTYSQVIEDKSVNASSPMAQETTSASSAVEDSKMQDKKGPGPFLGRASSPMSDVGRLTSSSPASSSNKAKMDRILMQNVRERVAKYLAEQQEVLKKASKYF